MNRDVAGAAARHSSSNGSTEAYLSNIWATAPEQAGCYVALCRESRGLIT